MKIAIFGGTFNPPHKGHKNILQQSIKQMQLDKVYVIPNNTPPHKKLPINTPSTKQRFEMCKILCNKIEKTIVSDIEISLGGQSFTIDTVKYIKNLYKNDDICLIIGADSFISFEKWKNFEEILSMCSLLVFEREHLKSSLNHKKYMQEKYNANIFMIKTKVLQISSSQIRQNLYNEFLDKEILEYIEKNNLYKE